MYCAPNDTHAKCFTFRCVSSDNAEKFKIVLLIDAFLGF